MMRNAVVITGLVAVGIAFGAARVNAQQPGAPDDPVSPAEIQRMFDSYALVQAQEQLKLSDEQFSQFFARFRSLQEVRRRAQNERMRRIQELRRLSLDPKSDEERMKDQLKALQDLDMRTNAEIKRAFDAIDQVLDVRQQAQFRVFEELMERRKIELVTRARQNNRTRPLPAPRGR